MDWTRDVAVILVVSIVGLLAVAFESGSFAFVGWASIVFLFLLFSLYVYVQENRKWQKENTEDSNSD
jgi:hypothetical protein